MSRMSLCLPAGDVRMKTGVVAWLNRVGTGQGFNPSIYIFSTSSLLSAPVFPCPYFPEFLCLQVLGFPVLWASPSSTLTGICDVAAAPHCLGYCFPICFVCSKKYAELFFPYCLSFSSLCPCGPAPLKSFFIGGIPEGEEIEACGKLAMLTRKFLCSIFLIKKTYCLFKTIEHLPCTCMWGSEQDER